MAKLDYHISEKLAEMMNTLAKKEHLERMITADEVRELSPDNTYDFNGYVFYEYNCGNSCILVHI